MLTLRLLLLVLVSAGFASAQSKERPNIIWLVAEDMSPWLGCYGDTTVPTPNCDRLAREGIRYANAFATSPVCAPARSSLITGMYATRIGTMQMRNNKPSKAAVEKAPDAYKDIPGYEGVPPAFVRCFPELLRKQGYYCTNNAKKDYQFQEPSTVWDQSNGKAHWRGRAAGQPFFAVFNYGGTHESGAFPSRKPSPDAVAVEDVPVPPIYPDTKNVRAAMKRTYDNIAAMDRWVGKKLKELEEAGLLDRTVVMYYSDHGVGLPRGKRSCYDTGTRVPLMVRFPDQRRAGETEKRVVQFVDFGPTVLSLCGVNPDSRLDGIPFLGKHRRNGTGYAYSHSDRFDAVYDRQRSVSDGRYRYVRNYVIDLPYLIPNAYRERIPMTQDLYDLRGRKDLPAAQWQMAATTRPVEEFYDSEADPWETANLIGSASHQSRIVKMRESLSAWMKDTNDLGFVLPESKLVREHIWPPAGKQPTTPKAEMRQAAGAVASVVTLSCKESGASIGYRVLPAKKNVPWTVYSKPFVVRESQRIEVVTHRIGWRRNTARFEVAPRKRQQMKPRADAPNVVVIVADDLGFMDIGANNPNCLYDTPNIDRLSRSAMRFTNGYAACSVCSPTRYALMTGRYPSRVDATNYFMGRRAAKFKAALASDRMEIDERTIAEELGDRGYATFFAGKWHLGPTAEFWPKNQGFDVNRGGFHRGGPYGGKKYFSPYGNPRLKDGPDGEHLPDRLAQEACDFIEQNKDGAFLTYLSFYSVHTPLIGRKDLIEKYKQRIAALPDDGSPEFGPEEQSYNNGKPRRVRLQQRHAIYAAMVEAMDQAVGKVLDKLAALGLDDNTIVVFTSDNGGLSTSEGSPTSNLPLRGGKGWMYEGGIREPWIWRVPGVTKAGTTCGVPMSSVDLLPTVLELTGHPAVSHEIDGVSIVSPLHAQPMPERALFWHYPHYGNQGGFPSSAIRLGQWKLIERLEDGRVHLFDLENDISEQSDLAKEQPERVAKMRDMLHAWYLKMDAKFLRERKGAVPWRPKN